MMRLSRIAGTLYSWKTQFGYRAYSCKNWKFTSIDAHTLKQPRQINVLFAKEIPVA